MKLRARDERDEWLAKLIGRNPPAFWTQANRWRAAWGQGVERWVWAPLYSVAALLSLAPALSAGGDGLAWLTVLVFAAGWWWGAWAEPDDVPADTDLLFSDEWEVIRSIAAFFRWAAGAALALAALVHALDGNVWGALLAALGAGLVIYRPLRLGPIRQGSPQKRRAPQT